VAEMHQATEHGFIWFDACNRKVEGSTVTMNNCLRDCLEAVSK